MAVNPAPETSRAPRRRFLPPRWTGGLSTRLLLLTAAFAIVVDLLILAPAAASFHERWLTDRVRAAEGELVTWPGVAIETTLWFVCLAERATEPALAALLDMVREAWHLQGAPTATAS